MNKIFINGDPVKTLSRDKLFGKYQHNLLVKSPLQFRLVCGESINVEDEERVFNTIQNISNSTTNNWPGHIIGNIFTRLQVQIRCKGKYACSGSTNDSALNDIHFVGEKLHSEESNTLFPYKLIEDFPHEWQAHLELIFFPLAKMCGGKKMTLELNFLM